MFCVGVMVLRCGVCDLGIIDLIFFEGKIFIVFCVSVLMCLMSIVLWMRGSGERWRWMW